MRAAILVGPTLPPRLRPTDPMWEWHPPARQGDVYRVAQTRPDAIGIIDGYFEIVPTVWHKEILWAMEKGIPVYGAASIGALRAAELDVFGMRGVGRIYEDFRDGALQDDDEVAVLHGPEELGYPALTEAMVNVRATLAEAVRRDTLTDVIAKRLIVDAKTLFYKERTWGRILDTQSPSGTWAVTLQDLFNRVMAGCLNQKRQDAESMLRHMRGRLLDCQLAIKAQVEPDDRSRQEP